MIIPVGDYSFVLGWSPDPAYVGSGKTPPGNF